MSRYNAQCARDAEATGYGDRPYWDYLEQSAHEHRDYWEARGDHARAQMMLTQTLGECLVGNDGA